MDEILGPINQVYFTIKPQEGIQATSFKSGDKFYIGGDKLLPLEKYAKRECHKSQSVTDKHADSCPNRSRHQVRYAPVCKPSAYTNSTQGLASRRSQQAEQEAPEEVPLEASEAEVEAAGRPEDEEASPVEEVHQEEGQEGLAPALTGELLAAVVEALGVVVAELSPVLPSMSICCICRRSGNTHKESAARHV